jgi:regulator of replication initiation timing
MQVLYSVSVEAVSGSDEDFDEIRETVIGWSSGTAEPVVGIRDVQGSADADGRRLSWNTLEVAGSGGASRLWTIEVCSPLGGAPGSEFVCAVAVSQADGRVGLHVNLGRRAPDAIVAPAPVEFVDRPRFVPAVLSAVQCRYGPVEPVSASPMSVRASEINKVLECLDAADRRLPVLVVSSTHAASPEARFARGVADRLAGLAHVVLLETWLALDALNARYALAVPSGGARLFWPVSAGARRHPWWGAQQLRDSRDVSNQLFTMISRLSVVANARDRLADAVRRAEREAATRAGLERVEAAVAVGDLERAVVELRNQLEGERRQIVDLLEMNELLEEENSGLKQYKENFEAITSYQASVEAEEPPSETITISPDFRELWPALEGESAGSLVFTDHAKDVWINSQYPHIDRMRGALEQLAKAAVAWRELGGQLGTSLTSWITSEVGLQYASDDEGMRRARLDSFVFEGRPYSRLSHIKLDDHVSPDRVGRIYFAIDKDKLRWIVDHVGVKIFSH